MFLMCSPNAVAISKYMRIFRSIYSKKNKLKTNHNKTSNVEIKKAKAKPSSQSSCIEK